MDEVTETDHHGCEVVKCFCPEVNLDCGAGMISIPNYDPVTMCPTTPTCEANPTENPISQPDPTENPTSQPDPTENPTSQPDPTETPTTLPDPTENPTAFSKIMSLCVEKILFSLHFVYIFVFIFTCSYHFFEFSCLALFFS